jgi:hypothetical protein
LARDTGLLDHFLAGNFVVSAVAMILIHLIACGGSGWGDVDSLVAETLRVDVARFNDTTLLVAIDSFGGYAFVAGIAWIGKHDVFVEIALMRGLLMEASSLGRRIFLAMGFLPRSIALIRRHGFADIIRGSSFSLATGLLVARLDLAVILSSLVTRYGTPLES